MENKEFMNYSVFFVDILGQKKRYEKVGKIVPSGSIKQIKEFSKDAFESVKLIYHMDKLIRENVVPITNEGIDIDGYGKVELSKIKLIGISDALLIFTPLKHEIDVRIPIASILAIISTCASIMNLALSGYSSIRGGCDVGWGFENEGQLHGYALTSAYNIESNVAVYPRIVLSEDLVNYIKSTITDDASAIGVYAKSRAITCLNLIKRDFDDLYIIDYLGDEFVKHTKETNQFEMMKGFINESTKFIDKELKEANNLGDNKLISKYGYLRKYFDFNMPKWI